MRTHRIAAASGAAYVVLTMIGSGLATGNGDPQDGPAILAHLQAGRSATETTGVVLQILGTGVLVAFLGYLYRVLRRAEGPDGWGAATAFGAGLVMVAVKLATAASGAAALFHADLLTPDLARSFNDLGGAGFVVSGFLFGLFTVAAAGSVFVSRALPRWLSVSGLIAGALTVAAGTAGILDPAGYVPIPFLLCLAWVLVTSIVLTVRASGSAPAGQDDATAVPAGVAGTA